MTSIPTITPGQVQTSWRGQKSIPIYDKETGGSVHLAPGSLSVLFSASAYQDPEATRLNLCFSPSPELLEAVQELDKRIVEQVCLMELFPPGATDWYRSPLKQGKKGGWGLGPRSMSLESTRCAVGILLAVPVRTVMTGRPSP